MKKYLIERHIPGVHKFTAAEYAGATEVSNAALAKLAPRIQWVESYVTEDPDAVRLHRRGRGGDP